MTDDDYTVDQAHADNELAEQLNAAHALEKAIVHQTFQIRARREAQRRINAAEATDLELPDIVTLPDFLNRQYDDPTYRIDKLWPTGGRVLLTAQWKAGKTTLIGNAVRSLADGDPFLNRYHIPRLARHIILIDNELDPRTLQAWLRHQNIGHPEHIQLLSLRGRVGTFNILNDDTRTAWAEKMTGADVVIFDCLRPVLDALGLDENHEAGRFLLAFDTLMADIGTPDAAIVHHMGHGPERSRGDSRLLDWADALWKLVRDKDEDDESIDDPSGARYFSAFGRDVDEPQAELRYDRDTRHLTIGTHTRAQATEHRKLVRSDQAVIAAVNANPGLNKTGLRKACAKLGVKHNPHVDESVERLVGDGLILREVTSNGHLHYPGRDIPIMGGVPSVPTPLVGTVNQPLTWENNGTVPTGAHDPLGTVTQQSVTDPTLPTTRGHATRRDDQALSADRAQPVENPVGRGVPNALKGALGTPQNQGGVPTTKSDSGHTPPTTKTCPDCEEATIPTNATRCQTCMDHLVARTEAV